MRFFFGVLTGGALTWAASLVFGDYLPSPGPAFRWIGAQLEAPEEIIDRIRAAPMAAVPDEAPRTSERAPTREPEPRAIERPALAHAPTGDAEPTAHVPADEIPARPRTPQLPDEQAAESFEEPAVVVTPQPNGWESAWVPFQTQRSAAGFAQVLTRHVQHPFEVRREASHRYRVTFAYADQAERVRVLAAVRSVTGAGS